MKKQKKAILAFGLVMVAALLSPCRMPAQNGGALGVQLNDGEEPSYEELNGRGMLGRRGTGPQGMMGNQTFGLDLNENYTPLGSGLALLVVAGIGYALMKPKQSEE